MSKRTEAEIINDIEKTRSRNNKNWMNIIRLAMEKAPEETKKIMSAIAEEDAKVQALTLELAGVKNWKLKNA